MLQFGKRLTLVMVLSTATLGEPLIVPNYSFESPPVTRDEKNPFGALPFLDDWDETAVGLADEFDQNTGVFLNTDPQAADHITNADLDRLGFLSSLIGNDLRQEIDEEFELGRSYSLTFAIGTSSAFPVGSTEALQVALFYFDGGVEQVVASSTVTGSQVAMTSLLDVTVNLPPVGLNDAWLNKPIGVLVRPSPTDPDDLDGEGFWNIDFVRLDAFGTQIPAVSSWGLAITTMLLATTGSLQLRRRAMVEAS